MILRLKFPFRFKQPTHAGAPLGRLPCSLGVMSKHHLEMAKASGSQLRHFVAYRNGIYLGMVQIHNVTIANSCEMAEQKHPWGLFP